MKTIAVATDFSTEADVAVDQAVRLTKLDGAELFVLHVTEPVPIDRALEGDTALASLVRDEMMRSRTQTEALVERLSAGGVKAAKLLVEGHPDEAIVQAADAVAAELVVLGTHGRTGFARLLLGSVAERVVRLAHTDVMVARPPRPGTSTEGGYRCVLVPYDFTAASEAAVRLARWLMAPDGTLELLHVTPPPIPFVPPEMFAAASLEIERARELARVDVKARLGRVVAEESLPGFRVVSTVTEGPPTTEIHRVLEEGRHELVVMGTHGRRGIRRSLLGSVAEATVRHAPCSVIVVRAPA